MIRGCVDLQVNGYGGVDFNRDGLTADALRRACVLLREHGVARILATVITERLPTMCGRLARLRELREQDPLARDVIRGFPIEGPFLNESSGYRGAHPADAIAPANEVDAGRLIDACGGLLRLMTLAPERDPGLAVTRLLARSRAAADAGLSLFTHLGNGCPMQMHRHDKVVQRVLRLCDRITPCFIADGVHVPLFALGNYLKIAGVDRCIVVTDCMAAAGLGPGRYTLSRWDVVVGEDLAARAPDGSHLVGSAMTMPQNAANLIDGLGLSPADVERLLVVNPSRVLDAS